MRNHRSRQVEIIDRLEDLAQKNASDFSTVTPVADFENDPRICLTSVHFPLLELKNLILKEIQPLKYKFPEHYYYDHESLHLTIKNIRVINDPPHFNKEDIKKAENIFSNIIPRHSKFNVCFFKLLLFPNNLSLIGTTDQELDNIILDLDEELKRWGLADDKKYINSKYLISNVTLARFTKPVTPAFRKMVNKISKEIETDPYTVDSVSLITANAVLKKLQIINSWKLME